jgi:hypothetical protein
MSPSALAHLVASAVNAGGYAVPEEATGSRYAEPLSMPSGTPPPPRLRRILLGTGIAVLVGGVLGIGGTWIAGLTRDNAGQTTQKQRPTPNSSVADPGAGPANSGQPPSAQPSNINNPQIAPVITRLEATRTSVLLQWRDPSQGKALFVVVRVRDGEGRGVRSLRAGTTQAAVEGLDPATAPYCFRVFALLGPERGVSAERCAEVPE